MWMVVGLGNPGPRYARNRHNVGFRVVDLLASRHGLGELRSGGKLGGESATGVIVTPRGRQRVALLKPMEFMNLSGFAVQKTARFHDVETGTIYVLRSQSELPFIVEHRELIHKIGVTGGAVETRIANAVHEATYLLAEVEVIATYKLVGINRTKLENIIHRVFAPAQLDVEIKDRFGHPVVPREWFLVPVFVVDEAVKRIRDGSITQYVYDPKTARLVQSPNR